MILWKGHCSVHGRFSAEAVDELREKIPGVKILVHPECKHEVVLKADLVGSTEFIIKTIEAAPPARAGRSAPSSTWSSGWRTQHPDKNIIFLDKTVCYCSTMNRIDLPHFVWAMESPGRRQGGQRDRGRPRDRALRQARAAADARPARQVPPRLSAAYSGGVGGGVTSGSGKVRSASEAISRSLASEITGCSVDPVGRVIHALAPRPASSLTVAIR